MPVEPPRPASRPRGYGPVRTWLAFRTDIFSSQPERLYRAWMAELRTPFYRSATVLQPELAQIVLGDADAFPKSRVLGQTLGDLLGASVFVANGAAWKRARTLIDPAFSGGRVREMAPQIEAASQTMCARLSPGTVEVEEVTARATADVILRVMFDRPIEDAEADAVFHAFRAYQRAQPLASPADLMRLPRWIPRLGRRRSRAAAQSLRALVARLVAQSGEGNHLIGRLREMQHSDGTTGFSDDELLDQAVMFLLAGHETSASALSWALLCLALDPEVQDRAVAEVRDAPEGFAGLREMPFLRDIWREVLRLYPPVPMLPRETRDGVTFRKRRLPAGSPLILSPWHSGRHERLWERAHVFDPDRWRGEVPQGAYYPYSAGPRICPGAGFATTEGVLMLAAILRQFELRPVEDRLPRPVAHLTVRADDGIWLRFSERV
ncbi:cytochrome P450 [Pontivivens insulae]|uniref:Pentalenene oxygenase n=1 Tax=Pontivivens insulae TaxID=1639689 RepID=A0A2R8ACJ5_9RHOB|nr:cytochrome P450 [Pontivivens insulae]RED13741.1 cytochrome P450 [Pontivivens insulae]SPF29815.1 Pentalenene oxygenase [Pontivivens insulae]